MTDEYIPTEADKQFLNDIDRGVIGITKPRVKHTVEPYDKYSWVRYHAAKKLGIPESELADEPDEMPDHSDQQGWS